MLSGLESIKGNEEARRSFVEGSEVFVPMVETEFALRSLRYEPNPLAKNRSHWRRQRSERDDSVVSRLSRPHS